MGSGVTILGTQVSFHRNDAAQLGLGFVVQRATAALPQTATAAIFTVTGRVLIKQILGEVTTVIQTQACNLSLEANPTATGSSVALCAVRNISADAVATLYGITGTAATALQAGLAILAQATPVIVQAGTIDLVASASNTGAVSWLVRYFPLTDDSLIVAA